MTISYVSGDATNSDSITLPAHQTDDLILIFAYNQGATIPSIPAGYTNVNTLSNNGGLRLGYKIATSASETSGTWTNAEAVNVQVYRSNAGTLSIGSGSATNADFSTSVTYQAITLDDTSGSSWVAPFMGHQRNDTSGTPPTGTVSRTSVNVTALDTHGFDTNGGVTSWTQQVVSETPAAGFWVSVVAEIVETGSSVVINDVTDPISTNSTLTVNGSGFEANDANSKIEQIQGAITVLLGDGTWGDTQIVTTSADVESTTLKYGTHDIKVTAHSGANASKSTSAIPALNNDFVNITSVATEGDRITAIPDLAANDQIRYQSLLHQGGSPASGNVTVNADATFSISGNPPDGNYTFEVRVWDANDQTWGTAANQNVTISAGDVTDGMISPMVSAMIEPMIGPMIKS